MSARHDKQSQLIKGQILREEKQKRPHRRPVDLLHNTLDFQSAMLAGFGFSAHYIARQTGFSSGQIYYRLRRAHIKIADYRNGRGIIAARIWKEHHEECEPLLRKAIADALRK